jgi:hypothetical protein
LKHFLTAFFGILTLSVTVFGNEKIEVKDHAQPNMTLTQASSSISDEAVQKFTAAELNHAKSGRRFVLSGSFYCLQKPGFTSNFAAACGKQQMSPNPTAELKEKGQDLCLAAGAKSVEFFRFSKIKSLGISSGGGGAERVDIVLGLDMACGF